MWVYLQIAYAKNSCSLGSCLCEFLNISIAPGVAACTLVFVLLWVLPRTRHVNIETITSVKLVYVSKDVAYLTKSGP